MHDVTKETLLIKISESDEQAFEEFVGLFYGRLKGFASTIIHEEEVAEEIVMDVFLKLWQQRATLEKIKNIDTFLFVMVRNLALNALRDGKKMMLEVIDENTIDLLRYEATQEGSLITQEMLVQLNNAVDKLPSRCKMVFKLLREEQLSRQETADILGVSVKTVDAQVAIAVEKIASELKIEIKKGTHKRQLSSFLLTL